MVLRTQTAAGTKIYDLSGFGGGVSVFERQRDKDRRKKKNAQQQPQDDVVLLQDFEFPVASSCIRVSADLNFIGAAGVYPPQMRVFDVHGLGLKFQRGLDNEPIDFRFLSGDYTKIALLERGRWIELHAQGGRHHRLRIPAEGTCLTYVQWSATLCSSSNSNNQMNKSKVYLLDLESGSFIEPWQTASSIGYCCFHSELLPLVAVGETAGRLECFDARTGKAVALLRAADRDGSITAGAFSPDSLEVVLGTSSGKCLIFDLRHSRPLLQFEHRNFAAVNTLQWLKPPTAAASAAASFENLSASDSAAAATAAATAADAAAHAATGGRRVASCDGVSIKVWSANAANCMNGSSHARLLASIEAPVVWENPVAPRNDKQEQQQQRQKEQQQQRVVRFSSFSFYGDSGLVLASTDHKQMGAYFLPSIGLAPKWCPMLDGLTEELEEQQQTGDGSAAVAAASFASLQFLTEQQMQQLNAQQLIGSPLVTRYLHGYFISRDLRNNSSLFIAVFRLQAAAEPFAFEAYRQQKIEERLEKKKTMRIQVRRKLPKTNTEFAEKLHKILESTNVSGFVPSFLVFLYFKKMGVYSIIQLSSSFPQSDLMLLVRLATQEGASKREKREAAVAAELLQDSRFSRLFSNPDFQLEQEEN
ncbi:hypothetical protein Efla_007348 [Eimeria flavescens]